MPKRRFPIGLVAPIALVVLVAALGALQYRWVGQVSERERDELRQSLDRRARDFADEFDREISRAFEVFTPEQGFTAAQPDKFIRQRDEWQSASRYPALVKAEYFAEAADEEFTLFAFDRGAGTFRRTAWPEHLAPVHAKLVSMHGKAMPQMTSPTTMVAISATPVLPSVPAMLIPEIQTVTAGTRAGAPTAAGVGFDMLVTMKTGPNHVVLELDRGFIASEMIPALTARHFTGTDGAFRVSVSDGRTQMFSQGLRDGEELDRRAADVAVGFFGLRMDMIRSVAANAIGTARGREGPAQRTSPAAGSAMILRGTQKLETQRFSVVIGEGTAGAARAAELRMFPGGWTLLAQHSAGSLDAAVAQARRRNLFLSFGILSVLAASAGLVMINARRSQKLAAQQMDFVATVSHELRTPLAVIRSAAQNLSAGVVSDTGQARKYGELIETEGRRLTDMVEQVLEFAGLSDARRRVGARPLDAAAVARDVVDASMSLSESADVVFDVQTEADLPPVLADEDALRRALHNLVGNALKYAADGRWVGVSVARGRGADSRFVLVSVADRGPGIPAGDLAHIFEPFYRGRGAQDQQIRGNGLGLSLVKRIVDSAGGRVTVSSSPESGSTFTLYLPVATGVPDAAVDTAAPALADPSPDRGRPA